MFWGGYPRSVTDFFDSVLMRTKAWQTTEVSSRAIQQMHSGCSFTSLAVIDE